MDYPKDNQPFLFHNLCLKVLTVHVNELHLIWVNILPLLLLLMSRAYHISVRYHYLRLKYDAVAARLEHVTLPIRQYREQNYSYPFCKYFVIKSNVTVWGKNKGSSYLIENSNTPVHSIIASYNKDNYAHKERINNQVTNWRYRIYVDILTGEN